MTGKKLLILTFVQWVILAVIKYCFFNFNIFAQVGLQKLVYWVLVGVVATAVIRRFGVISFVEVLFIIFLWTVFNLLFDLLWLSPLVGTNSLESLQYWVGAGMLGICSFLFHKIRHIHKRHASHH